MVYSSALLWSTVSTKVGAANAPFMFIFEEEEQRPISSTKRGLTRNLELQRKNREVNNSLRFVVNEEI